MPRVRNPGLVSCVGWVEQLMGSQAFQSEYPAASHRHRLSEESCSVAKTGCTGRSKMGHPTHIFGEKQSHQVIENTEEGPKIGQNNPNLEHLVDPRDSSHEVGC